MRGSVPTIRSEACSRAGCVAAWEGWFSTAAPRRLSMRLRPGLKLEILKGTVKTASFQESRVSLPDERRE